MASHLQFNHINQYAMQSGITLGLYGVMGLATLKWSLSAPAYASIFVIIMLCSPFFCLWLTYKTRQKMCTEATTFTFSAGYLHSNLSIIYASFWTALVTFIYLRYFDHGAIWTAYEQSLNSPEMQLYLQQSGLGEEMKQMTGASGTAGMVDALRAAGPTSYAAAQLVGALFVSPFISFIVGLICRRK